MSSLPTILVIDDEEDLRYSLDRVLSRSGYRIEQAASGEEGLRRAEALRPPVILLDNRMGAGMNGIETLQHLRSTSPHSMVILMTAFGTTQTAIEAMKFGAFDYIIKPFDIPKIAALVEKAFGAYRDLNELEKVYSPLLNSDDYREGIVGSSEAMQEVFKVIGQVAASDVTVMITGESGTGKELVARCIWQHSLRSTRAFIAVNCAAIPENLIESELFGHEKGSFTGATNLRRGKFELCDGGTIFLDEIGDMSLPTQTKILRALQEGEIQRVGGAETTKVDVRLLAATNKDLEKMVAQGTFREDLYYRLNVVRLRLPSLRERRSDIPALVDFMLQKLGKEHKIRARRFAPDALALLCAYNWPGNVRELENLVHRSAVVAQGEAVLRKDLPIEILKAAEKNVPPAVASAPVAEAPAQVAEPSAETGAEAGAAGGNATADRTAADSAAQKPAQAGATSGEAEPHLRAAALPVVTATGADKAATSGTVQPTAVDAGAEGKAAATADAIQLATGDASALGLDALFDALYAKLQAGDGVDILARIESEMMRRALRATHGNQLKTAKLLGITRGTLRKRIETLGTGTQPETGN